MNIVIVGMCVVYSVLVGSMQVVFVCCKHRMCEVASDAKGLWQTGCGRCEGGWEEGVAVKIPKHFHLAQ